MKKKKSVVKGSGKGTLFKKAFGLAVVTAAAVMVCAAPALASGTSAITGKITNLYNLVLGIIKAAGAIVLAWGVFEFAAGYQSHDSAQQTQSLKKVISGILMCGASTVIALVK